MATIKFSNGQSVKFDGTPTPEDIEFVAQQLGIGTVSPGEQFAQSQQQGQGNTGNLNFRQKMSEFGEGFVKKSINTAGGGVGLLQKLGQGTMSLGALMPGGDTVGQKFNKLKRDTGIQSFNRGSEENQRFQDFVALDNNIQKAGGVASDFGSLFAGGVGIANKAASAGTNLASRVSRGQGAVNLGTRAAVEGAGFGAVTAAQEGEVNSTVAASAALGGAFPVLGAGAKKITGGTKTIFSKLSDVIVGAKKKDLLKKITRNPKFFEQAKAGDITVSSVADDLITSLNSFSKNSFDRLNTARKSIPSKTVSTGSLDAGLQKKIRSVAGLSKDESINLKSLLENLPEIEAKAINQLLKRGRALARGKTDIDRGSASIKALDELRMLLDKEKKRLSKGAESSEVFKFLRDTLNKTIDANAKGFGAARATASKEIKQIEKLVANLTGLKPQDIRAGDVLKVEKIPTKVKQIINSFDDPTRFEDTLELVKILDDKVPGSNLLNKFEGLVGHLEAEKLLPIGDTSIVGRAGQAVENLVFEATRKMDPARRKVFEKIDLSDFDENQIRTLLKAFGVSIPGQLD